jgi:xylose dehydrogenase (NAD/NADP)
VIVSKVKYGILSTSQIARNQHIPAARESKNSDVVAISSRNLAKVQECARYLSIPRAYGTYHDMLSDPDIDAIINPLPNSLHCEWTVKAAEAGKHILCEKPLAVSVEQATKMIDAAKTNGVLLMEGFTPRFEPQIELARGLIKSKEIGALRTVRSELTYTIRDWENDTRTKPELAGGSLLDAGCYCVNIIRHLLGEEPKCVAALHRVHPEAGVDAAFSGLMTFSSGCLGYILAGMEHPFRACCEIIGSEGRLYIPGLFGGGLVEVFKGQSVKKYTFTRVNRFRLQIEHFSDCILNGTPLRFPPEDGLANTRVLVALQQAAESGRTVTMTA